MEKEEFTTCLSGIQIYHSLSNSITYKSGYSKVTFLYLSKIILMFFQINDVARCNKGYIFPQSKFCGEEYSLTCVPNKLQNFVAPI